MVFGHWSTLKLMLRENAICLDTGCVWGGELTAVRLQDRRTVRIACPQSLAPSDD
jgi:bis(5'-nucleosyl)-tetraphosphatase (symmetrical)